MALYSRTHLAQIAKRSRLVAHTFDPSWRCLICGKPFKRCYEHSEEQNVQAIQLAQESSNNT